MLQTNTRVPTFSSDLINKLDQDYPNKCPDPLDDERSIWMRVGARRLVDKLKTHLTMDEEDATEE